jgi:hypothetical protein
MEIEIARIVVVGITAIGVFVWLAGLRFLVDSWRLRYRRRQDPAATEQVDSWLSGAVDVEGEAGVLAGRAARVLAKGALQQLGPVKVLDVAEDRVRFERAAAVVANTPGQWFRRGELRFMPSLQGRSRVSWLVEPAPTEWLLWGGGVFQAVGLLALVAGCWAVYTYLASSTEPALRWQALQMLQVCHFLWPPFLFAALYRAGTRSLTAQFETLAQNLPYCEE